MQEIDAVLLCFAGWNSCCSRTGAGAHAANICAASRVFQLDHSQQVQQAMRTCWEQDSLKADYVMDPA